MFIILITILIIILIIIIIIIRHHHSSSSFVIIIRHHHSSSSFVIIIRHHHSSSSFVIIIRHHHSSSSIKNIPLKDQIRKSRDIEAQPEEESPKPHSNQTLPNESQRRDAGSCHRPEFIITKELSHSTIDHSKSSKK